MNQALRGKLVWKLAMEEDREWIRVCQEKYLQGEKSILIVQNPPYGSPFWNGLMQTKDLITNHIAWEAGTRDTIYF